jgi:hypothetical protein
MFKIIEIVPLQVLIIGLLLVCTPVSFCDESSWVSLGEEHTLVYQTNERGDRIPDFSHCGYMGGSQSIPDVPIQLVVSPIEGDNTERIQQAIDIVSSMPQNENGIRGAVLLLQGKYPIHKNLRISTSGVVLRGQGMNEHGTLLIATGSGRRTLIEIAGTNDKTLGDTLHIINKYVPVGSNSFRLTPADALKVGDSIEIFRPSTQEWIDRIGMSEFAGGLGGWRGWKPGTRNLTWARVITSIDNDQITFDAPITTSIDDRFGDGYIKAYSWPGRIAHVGIENLRCESEYDCANHKDEAHSWFGVTLNNVENAWVRQVTFSHFACSAVFVGETSKWISVQDCLSLEPNSEIGGYRRHSFFTMGQMTLFLRCYSEQGRHDFSVGHCAAGPNAFVQCEASRPYSFSGPIESWASGVLYDNVTIDGNAIRLFNHERKNNGVGWSAANCVLWQCNAAEIQCENPPESQNWVIGCWAEFLGDGYWLSSNETIKPQSLYVAQLTDRLNQQPSWIQLQPLSMVGATSPSVEQAQLFTNQSRQPQETLLDYIQESKIRNPIPCEPDGIETIDTILTKQSIQTDDGLIHLNKTVSIRNGWLTVNGKILTGRQSNVTWWRGSYRTSEADGYGPGITRYVPGRVGKGLTDDLNELTDTMRSTGYTVLNHNHGLWYDRRRDDHERVRRMDGNVVPPFFEMPFARSGQGTAWDGLSKYDLTKFNPWYWDRLKTFAELCDQNGLLLLHHNYFQHNIIEAGAHWADYPWRTVNNINQTDFPEPPNYIGNKRIFMDEYFYNVHHPIRRSLHQAYIRKCLDNFKDHTNVIQFIGAEFTGPFEFMRFWLETIRDWKNETGQSPLIGLSCTKDVQDAVLSDPELSELISVIDIRYWWYQSNGKLYAPEGGKHLAPRQHARIGRPKSPSFEQVYRAVREYRDRFPNKAIIYSVSDQYEWAILMGGGSIPNIRWFRRSVLGLVMDRLKPIDLDESTDGIYALSDDNNTYWIYVKSGETLSLKSMGLSGEFYLSIIDPKTGNDLSWHKQKIIDYDDEILIKTKPCLLILNQKEENR